MTIAAHILLLLPLVSGVLAHGKPASPHEIAEQESFLFNSRGPVSNCKQQMKARGLLHDAAARRSELAASIKKKRGLPEGVCLRKEKKRDLDDVLDKNHRTNLKGLEWDTDPNKLFGTDKVCLLTPETTEGPYYIAGEYIRPNVAEDQKGVPLYLDVQLFDINSCNPLEGAFFEIWQTNATGVYSGVHARGNGDYSDEGNQQKTFLRGLQESDDKGVVQFETIFPGHYPGRAIHIHVLATIGAKALSNGTISGGHISHVGQIFFDQSLITAVEKTAPYNTNTAKLTLNEDDSIAWSQAKNDYDPFVEYALLGDTVDQGILGWIALGIDPKKQKNIYKADTRVGKATTTTGGEEIRPPPTGTNAAGGTGTGGADATGGESASASATGGSGAGSLTAGLAKVAVAAVGVASWFLL